MGKGGGLVPVSRCWGVRGCWRRVVPSFLIVVVMGLGDAVEVLVVRLGSQSESYWVGRPGAYRGGVHMLVATSC